MENEQSQQTEIKNEFHRLGENLKAVFHGAWESEERVRLQHDLESGLKELGGSIGEVLADLESSETGQRFKADVEDLQTRAQSGELEEKARTELKNALDLANRELEKLAERWKKADETDSQDQAGTGIVANG